MWSSKTDVIIPFLDIIINILIFVLATVSVTFITSIQSVAPSAGGTGSAPYSALLVSVLNISSSRPA